jgi:hypothetical protein
LDKQPVEFWEAPWAALSERPWEARWENA